MEKENPHTIKTKKDADDFLYKDSYFAFLDILGFKALVKNNTHAALVELYENLFTSQTLAVYNTLKKLSKRQAEKKGDDYTDTGLQMINISDSILIWTKHGQPSAVFEIVYAVSSLLGISIVQGLPMRGCITRQPFTVIQKNGVVSVIGSGLVHAYEMENIQQWSGCIVDEEIIKYFRSIEKHFYSRQVPAPIERNGLVFEYDVPVKDLKTGRVEVKKGFAVNWSESTITDDMIRASFDAHNKKDERPASDTLDKVNNTLAFHHFCLEKKRQTKTEN
jgi:hypothetical protein